MYVSNGGWGRHANLSRDMLEMTASCREGYHLALNQLYVQPDVRLETQQDFMANTNIRQMMMMMMLMRDEWEKGD